MTQTTNYFAKLDTEQMLDSVAAGELILAYFEELGFTLRDYLFQMSANGMFVLGIELDPLTPVADKAPHDYAREYVDREDTLAFEYWFRQNVLFFSIKARK